MSFFDQISLIISDVESIRNDVLEHVEPHFCFHSFPLLSLTVSAMKWSWKLWTHETIFQEPLPCFSLGRCVNQMNWLISFIILIVIASLLQFSLYQSLHPSLCVSCHLCSIDHATSECPTKSCLFQLHFGEGILTQEFLSRVLRQKNASQVPFEIFKSNFILSHRITPFDFFFFKISMKAHFRFFFCKNEDIGILSKQIIYSYTCFLCFRIIISKNSMRYK